MTKPVDPDLIALKMADKAMRLTTPRMRKAGIQFLWDKYVINVKPEEPKTTQQEPL